MVYFELALKEVPRLLSLIDRDKHSPTYGCFDRNYWRYKTSDYTNDRLQEACYTLALLYKNKYPGNEWYKNEKIREYAIAAMNFWSARQNSDGSFNEYLPNEHSHVATAFSACAVASTYEVLGLNDENLLSSLEKAANWLGKNDDLIVANHDAAAVAALYLVYKISGDAKYKKFCEEKLSKVLENQDSEGWFNEYGGADIGYQSYSIYYLAKYYEISRNEKILEPLERAADFFSYFAHPDHSIGGHYGSRETSFIIPAGFEILSVKVTLAKSISLAVRESLSQKKIAGPYSFDDRFLADCLYPYLEAARFENKGAKGSTLPKDGGEFRKYFKNCGIYVQKTPEFYIIVGTKKGGVCKIFSGTKLIHSDSGWVAEKDGRIVTTNGPSTGELDGDQLRIYGNFYYIDHAYQSPATTIALRFLNFMKLQRILKYLLRKKMILKFRNSNIKFKRKVKVGENRIEILDAFYPQGKIKRVHLTANFSSIYSTTAGLYEEEFEGNEIKIENTKKEIKIFITPGGASLVLK